MKVNFSDTDISTYYTAIPANTYNANVTDGELRTSQKSGSDYIHWEFTISDGEFEGRKIWSDTSLQPQALFGLKSLLAAVGKFDVDGDLDFEVDDVVGSPVKIVVKQRDYEREPQNFIKRYKAAGSTDDGDSSLLP